MGYWLHREGASILQCVQKLIYPKLQQKQLKKKMQALFLNTNDNFRFMNRFNEDAECNFLDTRNDRTFSASNLYFLIRNRRSDFRIIFSL